MVVDGYTWLCMVMNGYTWLCMHIILYGYEWLYVVIDGQLSEQLVAPDSAFAHLEYPPSFGCKLPSSDVIEPGHVGRTSLPL